jgi:hypothetical protein
MRDTVVTESMNWSINGDSESEAAEEDGDDGDDDGEGDDGGEVAISVGEETNAAEGFEGEGGGETTQAGAEAGHDEDDHERLLAAQAGQTVTPPLLEPKPRPPELGVLKERDSSHSALLCTRSRRVLSISTPDNLDEEGYLDFEEHGNSAEVAEIF